MRKGEARQGEGWVLRLLAQLQTGSSAHAAAETAALLTASDTPVPSLSAAWASAALASKEAADSAVTRQKYEIGSTKYEVRGER